MKLKILALVFIALVAIMAFSGCAQQACPKDAKICPDGTVVGRNPNNCQEFNPCPEGINPNDIPMPTIAQDSITEEPPELPL